MDPTAIGAVAALDDPVRHRLHAYVRRCGRPVTREEAAAAVGISKKLAAFHLDKLVDAGLLRAGVATGDRPRNVGRAPKTYRPATDAVSVSVPARTYQDLAEILIDVVAEGQSGAESLQARRHVARTRGRRVAENAERPRGRLGSERALTAVEGLLAERGYEPYRPEPQCVRMRNCPFHPLAARAPDLVCGINVDYVGGMVEGLGANDVISAELSPREGECCVEVRPRS